MLNKPFSTNRTHDLQDMSRLPYPIDQGFSLISAFLVLNQVSMMLISFTLKKTSMPTTVQFTFGRIFSHNLALQHSLQYFNHIILASNKNTT